MKYIIVILVFFVNLEIMAKQISELKWEKRLVVISFKIKEDNIYISSKKFIADNKCSIKDRNLEFIFFENFRNDIFKIPSFVNKNFGIWLIGYDGLIKDYSKDGKIFLKLFDIIDSMPMRKEEMIKDKC